MQETSTENNFGFHFPTRSFFKWFELFLINDIEATSGNQFIILIILKRGVFKNFWGIEKLHMLETSTKNTFGFDFHRVHFLKSF